MAHDLKLFELFDGMKYPKIVLAVGIILLLVLELGIYAAVSSQSGLKSRVIITDSAGKKIHESPGAALGPYEKMVFENNFGPLRNFNAQVESEVVPFPMRSWVLLAIGVPIGLILLASFMVQVWLLLLNGGPRSSAGEAENPDGSNHLTFLSASRNFSVLHLGFVILLTMLILWLIPSFLGDIAQSFFGMIREYQWFFLGVSVFAAGLLAWIVYLRYKLSRQMLENQLEIEKFRLHVQSTIAQDQAPQLLTAGSPEHEEVTGISEHELKAGES